MDEFVDDVSAAAARGRPGRRGPPSCESRQCWTSDPSRPERVSRAARLRPHPESLTFYRDGKHTSTLQDPVIGGIAEAHGKTPAQVMLRWGVQQGCSVIPKSTKPTRIAENLDVFEFDLTSDELAAIDGLDTGQRGGPELEVITLESFGRPIPED